MQSHAHFVARGFVLGLLVLSIPGPSAGQVGPPAGRPVEDVRDHGAVGDGVTDATAAFAGAVAACAEAGGGRVLVPAGIWRTGPIRLASGVELHVAAGARVVFNDDRDVYPLVSTRYAGRDGASCTPLVYGRDLHDVAITGPGRFDGTGQAWRPVKRFKVGDAAWEDLCARGGAADEDRGVWWPTPAARDGERLLEQLLARPGPRRLEDFAPARDALRPPLVQLDGCTDVLLDGPTFANAPFWGVHLLRCDDVTVRNITVESPWHAQNGDGLDIDSCRRVSVRNCVFDVGDDAICIKSGMDEDGRRAGRPSEDITVSHCLVRRGHGGFVVGSDMSGGVRRVSVSDCVFEGTDVGIRFKTMRGRGGVVEDVLVERIVMRDIRTDAIRINMHYRPTQPEPVSERTPRLRRIVLRDAVCQVAGSAASLVGLAEMPLEDVTLERVVLVADTGLAATDARSLGLLDVQVRPGSGPGLALTDCQEVSIRTSASAGEPFLRLEGARTAAIRLAGGTGGRVERGPLVAAGALVRD